MERAIKKEEDVYGAAKKAFEDTTLENPFNSTPITCIFVLVTTIIERKRSYIINSKLNKN